MSATAVAELLARCRTAGLSLVPEGEALHIDYESEPPAALIEEIRQHKPEVMAALSVCRGAPTRNGPLAEHTLCDTTPSWGEAEQERAAIVECDGNIPRAWAESLARLDPNQPPGDVPLRRWQRFVDDVGLFLDSPFCAIAAALGWGPYDLFGCDRDRPFARIDQAGLLWMLNGSRLIALSENTATIEAPTNARQTWRRKPTEPGRVVAWELAY